MDVTVSNAMLQVLKQCGDDFSRENFMKQAANLHELELSTLLPGIKLNTSPTDIIRSGKCSSQNSTVPTGSALAT